MNKLIKMIKNSHRIIMFISSYDNNSLKLAEYFWNYIYDEYLDNDFDKKIITKQDEAIRLLPEKFIYFFKGMHPFIRPSEQADLVIGMSFTYITVVKTRYDTLDGVLYDMMNFNIFQRKDKLNKLLINIKNEKRIAV